MGSDGGKATAIILRQKAINEYIKNPKICLYCKNPIPIDKEDLDKILFSG